ncbi:ECF transporter S component [Spiroplasma endosymbiont of Virgichneumon dumeticola]|uniref:ECF transporter S component n=1 Tax=Spiroplasma endosymbiont of Virgichneumon dumeticola TaxID=3139323 RepID=UPI0035C8FBF9
MNLKNENHIQQVKTYFISALKLTTHKVTMISILLALTTLISLLEIPTFFGFLTIDFGSAINLLAVVVLKLPYGLLIGIIMPWLRLIIPHTVPGNVVGELSYMLSTISLILIYCSFHMLFKLLPYWKNEPTNWWKRLLIVELPVVIITCILVSFVNVFFNWAFILDLYGQGDYKNQLWIVFLPYNLFKFTLVLGLFLLLIRSVQILGQHFNY